MKYLRVHQLPPSHEQTGSLKRQLPEKRPWSVRSAALPAPGDSLWLALLTHWSPRKDPITLPMEIYELPVWYTITATAHHIIFPEGLLRPMSSHLYLWQLRRDLVRSHFDKSHLKLINMGDTLPPWLGFLRRDWDLHCHSAFIIQGKEKERKEQGSGRAERKERQSGRGEHRRSPRGLQALAPCTCSCLFLAVPGRAGICEGHQLRGWAWCSPQQIAGQQTLWATYFPFSKHC